MMNWLHLNPVLYDWVVLPLLIFISRSCDVSLATLRNVFIARNIRNVVPIIGFFEVLLWLVAISTVLGNLNNVACYLGFAAGYANGIYLGLKIEERLALGKQLVRIFTKLETAGFVQDLYAFGMGVTLMDARGSQGPVTVVFTTLNRKDLPILEAMIQKHIPNSFYTIEDIRKAKLGVFPENKGEGKFAFLKALLPLR
ncbi:MAG: DUF2179 domain-containing protein [Bacteroidota bacterium]|jgi:uncharacterized protein YebE (UPF0316 family)